MAVNQQMEALERANKVRRAGARIKRQLRSRKLTLEKALDHKDAQEMKVAELLRAVPQWGPARVEKLLRRLDMNSGREKRKLKKLTSREKKLILHGINDTSFWVLKPGQKAPE